MRTLNERATEILCDLLKRQRNFTTNQDEVQVKVTGRIGKYNLVSLILYIDINGVRYRDPEIVLGMIRVKDNSFLTTT